MIKLFKPFSRQKKRHVFARNDFPFLTINN